MRIIVSFDTEDFTDPVSNDVLLLIARALSDHGVRAGFGLLGEKARFIRDLGRADVVEALSHHDICYHTDNHFLFPDPLAKPAFMSEYVEERSWDEAVRHLVATEAEGLRDIEELFGRRPTTYFRTGGDSAAQILYAYHLLGMTTFAYGPSLYERSRHIAWFTNMLCVSLPLISEGHTYKGEGPNRLDEFAAGGADLVNVRFHPCMFLADTFWCNVNFRGRWDAGRFGPWKLAPRLPREETRTRIHRMCQLVDYAREKHGAEFTTYDALTAEVKPNPPWLERDTVLRLARALLQRLGYVEVDGHYYSLAEAFAAIIWTLLHPQASQAPYRRVIGPVRVPGCPAEEGGRPTRAPSSLQLTEGFDVAKEDLVAGGEEAERSLSAYRRVPADVLLGGRTVPPATLLRVAAKCLLGEERLRAEPMPIYPEGFDDVLRQWDDLGHELIGFFPDRGRDTKRMKQAVKLQYWSYKPALLG
jgi:hypothetical protein